MKGDDKRVWCGKYSKGASERASERTIEKAPQAHKYHAMRCNDNTRHSSFCYFEREWSHWTLSACLLHHHHDQDYHRRAAVAVVAVENPRSLSG